MPLTIDPVDTVSSTAIVGASGIENLHTEIQNSLPSITTIIDITPAGSVNISTEMIQHGSIQQTDVINQFQGVTQTGTISTPPGSLAHSTALTAFPNTFERGVFVIASLGTSGSIESFFDTSPFFFTPSETDPNTLRDISEAQQFMLFSRTNVTAFDNFNTTVGTTKLVTDHGDFHDGAVLLTNIVTNGSFESSLNSWTIENKTGGDIVQSRTDQPTGVGFDDGNPLTPPDGNRMLYVAKRATGDPITLSQEFTFQGLGGDPVNSADLQQFSFSLAVDNAASNRQFQMNLIFFNDDKVKANLQYRGGSLGTPSALPADVAVLPLIPKTFVFNSSDVFVTTIRNLKTDLDDSFNFNKLQVWIFFDMPDFGDNPDFLLDDIQVTVELPLDQLLKTKSFAHVLTVNPTSSGLPFTVSGSDDITQVDLSPPFFDETSPASGTTQVPETPATLEFHVKDGGSALDPGTIEVSIDGESVVAAGATVTGVTWPISTKTTLAPGDIEYIFTRGGPFIPTSTVVVSGSFADLADVSNLGTETYQFTIIGSGGLQGTISGALDADPPVITATDPASSATQISPDTQVLWKITDNATGVDPSTVKLLLNGATKIENDVATEGSFSRTANSENGFDYVYTTASPFALGSTVTGSITAEDNSSNSSNLLYEFTITPDDTLFIEGFFLGVDESVLLTTGTLMSVDAVDLTHGVASGTTTLTVNGEEPAGLSTVLSGVGPNRVVFSVLVDPLVDFREDLVVVVHAENKFPGAFPVIKEQQFTLRSGYDVNWPNKSETSSGGPEETFPYLTNVEVLSEVKNFAKNFGEGSAFFDLFTESQHKSDLGAVIVSNVKTADIPAVLTSVNPFFEYGKTITLEIEADDLVGNQFRLTHVFTIEEKS